MSDDEETRLARALRADSEEVAGLIHDPSPRVIRALLGNPNLQDEDVFVLATRKNIPPDILESIAKNKRWSENYPIRLALARNAKTPISVSLTIARYLRLFDLEETSRNRSLPLVFRNKIEAIIAERIPTMPLGNKKTLAKKAAGGVLQKLLFDGDGEVVRLCLNNPHLTEAHLFKTIMREDTGPETIRLIAEHPSWSLRSLVRLSLVRSRLTPLAITLGFLGTMKLLDLRELYRDPTVPPQIRAFLHQELVARGEHPHKNAEVRVFEIAEEELAELESDPHFPVQDESTDDTRN